MKKFNYLQIELVAQTYMKKSELAYIISCIGVW